MIAADADGRSAASLPALLHLPLVQHHAIALSPVVRVGDRVLCGEPIAEPLTLDGVAMVAPTSGRIDRFAACALPLPGTPRTTAIVLAPDGADACISAEPLPDTPSPSSVFARLRAFGVLGQGGGGFPVAVKLERALAAQVRTLIVNGCECDLPCSADHAVIAARTIDIANGITVVEHALGIENTVVALHGANVALAAQIEAALATQPSPARRRVRVSDTGYPSGAERRLLREIAGIALPPGELPIARGYLCQNIATFAAIADAVAGRPMSGRVLTIADGDTVANRFVRYGTPIADLPEVAATGADRGNAMQILIGGRQAGYRLADASAPVTAHVHAITLVPPQPTPTACIGCGRCNDACPEHLPAQLMFRTLAGAAAGDVGNAIALPLLACLECGACDAACPSVLPLTEQFRFARRQSGSLRLQAQVAEHLRARHRRRSLRLAAQRDAQHAAGAVRRQRRSRRLGSE